MRTAEYIVRVFARASVAFASDDIIEARGVANPLILEKAREILFIIVCAESGGSRKEQRGSKLI